MESYKTLARAPPTRCEFFQWSVYCPYLKEMIHNKQRKRLKYAVIIIGIVIFVIAVTYLVR
jgi:accessory gene regulator protein AgrB